MLKLCAHILWERGLYDFVECEKIDKRDSDKLIGSLLTMYENPYRQYHTFAYVRRVHGIVSDLSAGRRVNNLALFLASWFHKACGHGSLSLISDTRQSALFAAMSLQALPVSGYLTENVKELILSLSYERPRNIEEEILRDACNHTLGADPANYLRYMAQLQTECVSDSPDEYISARRLLLATLLNRRSIYFREAMREKYERQARINLTSELHRLETKANLTGLSFY